MTQSVIDYGAIQNLYAQYSYALDDGDAIGYSATFAEDGAVWPNEGPFQESRGRYEKARMPELFANRTGYSRRHIIFNVWVAPDGVGAKALAGLFDWKAGQFVALLEYDDVLARVKGTWLFLEKRIRFLWQSEDYQRRLGG